ncbi:uncharacterized protein [Physcomitrium patens]|uniref:Photolyase/cryptochrome alpha/beta domain-containing protein n=1 Tax=Physcomitrium patens TaxID=3218 RepID=A0A2K1KTM8_PHYPA|nr:uncharacterized protein LOC112280026 [Physcomitrium patens]PNR57145.1 hypothetical protein PHYPA_004138 [Physcomitrium patens]|eukprot:XP_024370701.1 uncharacterized protein LOC112280026 [Physcomitrella patens]
MVGLTMAATIASSLQAALSGAGQVRLKPIEQVQCYDFIACSHWKTRASNSAESLHQCENLSVSMNLAEFRAPKNSLRRDGQSVKSYASPRAGPVGNGVSASSSKDTAILWFKHDLRLDDHPGVAAASAYKRVLPVYIFDPYVCAGWSKELLESLCDAVSDLRKELRLLGSDLIVLTARTEHVLSRLAQKIGATSIITEEEVESTWQRTVHSVLESLEKEEPSSISETKLELDQWSAPLYDTPESASIPDNYQAFQRIGLRTLAPLPSPAKFPGLPEGLTDTGSLPDFKEFTESVEAIRRKNPWWETLKAAQSQPGESLLPQASNPSSSKNGVSSAEYSPFKSVLKWRDEYILEGPQASLLKKQGLDVEEEEVIGEYFIKGGATGALNVLQGYLRFLEPTNRDDYKAVYEHIWEMEKKPGASFRKLFASSLALGTISRRRVIFEALQYERDRNGGRLSPFGFSTFTVGNAVGDVKAMEWFDLLQRKSELQASEKGFHVSAWRWKGYHIQYSAMGNEDGPAVLLVHGFGAFWEHYRDNLRGLANKGYRVYALTLIGFGRSEKPNMTYTELVWAELVRDFIVEVVKQPVVLAGNSIGGFTTTVVAGLWPSLVSSLVLLNTAGKVIPDYKGLTYQKPGESSPIAKPLSKLLLFYLQSSSDKLLTRCYPKQPSRVDKWLLEEVKRGSYDPGNTAVLESVFLLKAPLPLNFFLDRYKGNVLCIQGKNDPLQKNTKRPEMLQAFCSNVCVEYLDSGHCPHDELPEEVNTLIDEFVKRGLASCDNQASSNSSGMANATDDAPATPAEIIKEELKLIIEDLESARVNKTK